MYTEKTHRGIKKEAGAFSTRTPERHSKTSAKTQGSEREGEGRDSRTASLIQKRLYGSSVLPREQARSARYFSHWRSGTAGEVAISSHTSPQLSFLSIFVKREVLHVWLRPGHEVTKSYATDLPQGARRAPRYEEKNPLLPVTNSSQTVPKSSDESTEGQRNLATGLCVVHVSKVGLGWRYTSGGRLDERQGKELPRNTAAVGVVTVLSRVGGCARTLWKTRYPWLSTVTREAYKFPYYQLYYLYSSSSETREEGSTAERKKIAGDLL